mmetsp:Transcript_29176/g.35733  ORF Transcript_29176/g.35733 Transcript_29176/m.35733 type:complete len:96 (+) Transcript_29176:61-348(+)
MGAVWGVMATAATAVLGVVGVIYRFLQPTRDEMQDWSNHPVVQQKFAGLPENVKECGTAKKSVQKVNNNINETFSREEQEMADGVLNNLSLKYGL